jgi:tetrahydromethanopterin S-methyltransferase subunit E
MSAEFTVAVVKDQDVQTEKTKAERTLEKEIRHTLWKATFCGILTGLLLAFVVFFLLYVIVLDCCATSFFMRFYKRNHVQCAAYYEAQ